MQHNVIITPSRLKSRVYKSLIPAMLYVLQNHGYEVSSILTDKWGDAIEYAGDNEHRAVLDALLSDLLDALAEYSIQQITEIRVVAKSIYRIYWS